jgi:hypothetical protein
MVKFDTKKRTLNIILPLLILIIGIFAVYAVVYKTKGWHSADDFLISIDGYTMSLQEAITNNVFINGATTDYTTSISGTSHNADEIWISVNGNEMTLQYFLSLGSIETDVAPDGLCGSSSNPYSNNTNPSHFASEIEVSVHDSIMSLQDAIDTGELVSVDGGWSSWSGWSTCTVSCGGGTQTRTRTCTNPTPKCNGANCVGDPTDTQSCNTQSCVVYHWTAAIDNQISSYTIINNCGFSSCPAPCGMFGQVCSTPNVAYVCTPLGSRMAITMYIACM